MKNNKVTKSDIVRRKRAMVSIGIFGLCAILLIFRIGYIMIIKGPVYRERAKNQQYSDKIIYPTRGTIYDSTGKELAVSIPVFDLWVELSEINKLKTEDKNEKKYKEKIEELYDKLIKAYDFDKAQLRKDLYSMKPRLIIAPELKYNQVKKIKEKKVTNVWFDEKSIRYYPYGKFAAFVLGHVSKNNVGLAGIESYYDLELKGIPGRRMFIKDSKGGEISINDLKYNEPINGKNLILTINEVIQHNLEMALEKGYKEVEPKSVTGIIMESKTGNILAMSSIPDYDPNKPWDPQYDYFKDLFEKSENEEEKMKNVFKMWRNPSVNDSFEPGSPFKTITAASGLDEDVVKPQENFVDNGYLMVGGIRLGNWTTVPFGTVTFQRAVEQSINTIFMQVAQRLGKDRFLEYIKAFGFGEKTHIELPGEQSGMVLGSGSIGPVELANISYGQAIAVTPIQLVTAINAMANDGKIMEPHLIKEVFDSDNKSIKVITPKVVKQPISKETAKTVLSFMESVVKNGSGRAAAIEGYRIGGKTGTANKVEEGQSAYSKTKFVCTFAAIAPVEDPEITVLIVVDEPMPGKQYGSLSAAPIAKDVLQSTLKYLGVAQSTKEDQEKKKNTVEVPNLKGKKYSEAIKTLKDIKLNPVFEQGAQMDPESSIIDTFPQAGEKVIPGSSIMLYLKLDKTEEIIMPDLKGKTQQQVEKILNNMDLKPTFSGTGKVSNQKPNPGEKIKSNSLVSIELQ